MHACGCFVYCKSVITLMICQKHSYLHKELYVITKTVQTIEIELKDI